MEERGMNMEKKIEALIKDLKKKGSNILGSADDPEAKVNVWYVIARLEGLLLEKEKGYEERCYEKE